MAAQPKGRRVESIDGKLSPLSPELGTANQYLARVGQSLAGAGTQAILEKP